MPSALSGGLIINEILADPNGATGNFDTDGNGTAGNTDEYVELYNSGTTTLDISGVQLWDAGVGNWFTFPPGTLLVPGGHALVLSGVQAGGSLPTGALGDLFFDAGRGSPGINNSGDNVIVYDPGSNQYIGARFNGAAAADPVASFTGFPPTATAAGPIENFGNDIDGFSIQRVGDGADVFSNSDTPTPGVTNICFTYGTEIATPRGSVLVQDLKVGDLVQTLDNGAQPVVWCFAHRRPAKDIIADPRAGAVRIARGALGNGLPTRALTVSRQHRMLVSSAIAMRMYGQSEVLVPAKDLLGAPGITLAPMQDGFLFFHLLLPQHEVVFAQGAMTESLYLGDGHICRVVTGRWRRSGSVAQIAKPKRSCVACAFADQGGKGAPALCTARGQQTRILSGN